MDEIYSALRNCSIFRGIPEEKYPTLLQRLKGTRKHFQKDETILNIGDHSQQAGIVLNGSVELSFLDEGGNQVNVNHISHHGVFGTELACSNGICTSTKLRAITDCEILFLDFFVLMNDDSPLCPFRMRIATNLLQDFAQQTQFLNQRLRIISQKRLRDKIKVCLQSQPIDAQGVIHLPFKRNEWADYLYADRSALSRELGRMSEEGIITYRGQEIRILDQNFLKN